MTVQRSALIGSSLVRSATFSPYESLAHMSIASKYRLDTEPRAESPGSYDWVVYRGGKPVLKSPKPCNSQTNAEIAGREALERLRAEDIQWREG